VLPVILPTQVLLKKQEVAERCVTVSLSWKYKKVELSSLNIQTLKCETMLTAFCECIYVFSDYYYRPISCVCVMFACFNQTNFLACY